MGKLPWSNLLIFSVIVILWYLTQMCFVCLPREVDQRLLLNNKGLLLTIFHKLRLRSGVARRSEVLLLIALKGRSSLLPPFQRLD